MVQRRSIIPETSNTSELSRATEGALQEMTEIVNRKSIQNFRPQDVTENLQWLDEDANTLYVYNTLTKKWLYTVMTEV